MMQIMTRKLNVKRSEAWSWMPQGQIPCRTMCYIPWLWHTHKQTQILPFLRISHAHKVHTDAAHRARHRVHEETKTEEYRERDWIASTQSSPPPSARNLSASFDRFIHENSPVSCLLTAIQYYQTHKLSFRDSRLPSPCDATLIHILLPPHTAVTRWPTSWSCSSRLPHHSHFYRDITRSQKLVKSSPFIC